MDELLADNLYVDSGRRETNHGYAELAAHLSMLDQVRTRKLAAGGTSRISIHADILKSRHEGDSAPLADACPWDEFMTTDFLLYLRSHAGASAAGGRPWWPRTWIYFDYSTPRFLREATSQAGARRLARALGIGAQLKEVVGAALKDFNEGAGRRSMFSEGVSFDPATIADV